MASSQLSGPAAKHSSPLHVAGRAAAALEMAVRTEPRLVIVDMNTPEVDIEALVCGLRELDSPPAIIAYGPHVHESQLSLAKSAGCNEVLTKGTFHRQVNELLDRYLSR